MKPLHAMAIVFAFYSGHASWAAEELKLAATTEKLTAEEEKALRAEVKEMGLTTGSIWPKKGEAGLPTRVFCTSRDVEKQYAKKPKATVRVLLTMLEKEEGSLAAAAACNIQALVWGPQYAAITAQGSNWRKFDEVIGGANPLTFRQHDREVCIKLIEEQEKKDDALAAFLKPQTWTRDSDKPALSLGEKGKFDDQHIFAPHVIMMNGEYWMYYCGSQRCIGAGTYKGTPKANTAPEKIDQRLFKLGLAKSKDGIHFTRHSAEPVFSFGDDIHSIVTAAILKNPDGSVCRENGKLRMYFAAVDFPGGTYKHRLYETTSADGIEWAKPTLVMENAYAPCVVKEGDKYRMWYTWIDKHPWHTSHAESKDGTKWTLTEKPCIVMDQEWEKKDQVYPMVLKVDDAYLMLYGCYWNDDKHTALGFAASKDGLSWTKHPENPVFKPEPKNDWESNFTTSQSLMKLPDGSFRLWYAGRKQPPWSNLYFAIGTAHWKPGKVN